METYHIYFTTVATGEENVASYEAETENHARTFFFEDFGSEVVIDGVEVEPYEQDYDDSMDGDFDSAMASAGFGTDEDYGYADEVM